MAILIFVGHCSLVIGENLGKADQDRGLIRFVVLKEKIEMSDLVVLNDDDVVSMDKGNNIADSSTAKISEIRGHIKERTCRDDKSHFKWVEDGVDCELLQISGGGWQKGKIRIRLEFIPDEPKSPLDDLRSNLDI